MFLKRNNDSILQIESNESAALGSCSNCINLSIAKFFDMCSSSKIKWDGKIVDQNIVGLTEAAMYLAQNTLPTERLSDQDLKCMDALIKELELVYREVRNNVKDLDMQKVYSSKIELLADIFWKNMGSRVTLYEGVEIENDRDGMVFERYEDLLRIVHIVNSNYEDLVERRFTPKTLYDFKDYVLQSRRLKRPLSEDEKVEKFLGILNGTMKFHPLYEYQAVGYEIVPTDFSDTLVDYQYSRYQNGYSLEPSKKLADAKVLQKEE